ncbi:hypothetical protein LCGC14_1844370 [marine sediment metagenome]|uniref:Uncharacterized protein n=1 Tax=marine sediment metagenome TaxID=412755 RepID=A0A0F9GC89_9ZZZZ
MKYLTGLIGMWIFSDAVYSTILYLNSPSYDGKTKQTWKKDHSIRVVRGVLAIALMVMGGKK